MRECPKNNQGSGNGGNRAPSSIEGLLRGLVYFMSFDKADSEDS